MMRWGDCVVEVDRCCTQTGRAVCHTARPLAQRLSATVDKSRGIVSGSFGRTIGAAARLVAWLGAPIDVPAAELDRAPAEPADLPRAVAEPTHGDAAEPDIAEAQAEAAVRHRAAASLRFL